MVSRSWLKNISNSAIQWIRILITEAFTTYPSVASWNCRFSKKNVVSSSAGVFYNCKTSTNPNWLLCYRDDKLEGSPRQTRSSKQTDKACVKDATSYSFVRKCEKLRMWISHLVIYMKMLFHRCGHRLSLIASSKSLMRIRNGFNPNWLDNQ